MSDGRTAALDDFRNWLIHAASSPLSWNPQVTILRTAVREQDPAAALDSVMTMEERVMTNLAEPQLYAVLPGAFGFFALVIAGVGLFGVLSYAVAQRSREIGVRTALGAQTRDIIALVLKHAAAVAISGVVLGLAASLVLSRFLAAFLYGVTAHDTMSFAVVAVVLALVAGIACASPLGARHASIRWSCSSRPNRQDEHGVWQLFIEPFVVVRRDDASCWWSGYPATAS